MFKLITLLSCASCISLSKFDIDKAKTRFDTAKSWATEKKDSLVTDAKDLKEIYEQGDIVATRNKVKEFTTDTI